MLGDWLVVNQVLPVNPAAAVRGPKHVVTKGSTPVLSPAEARKLLETIDTDTLAGLRDRALLSVMLYSFARVSAVFGDAAAGPLRAGEPGLVEAPGPTTERPRPSTRTSRQAESRNRRRRSFQTVDPAGRRLTSRPLERPARPCDDQAAPRGRGAPVLDVLPHVPGDGGSQRICQMEVPSNTPSRSRDTRLRRRRSSTTGRPTLSPSTKSSAS